MSEAEDSWEIQQAEHKNEETMTRLHRMELTQERLDQRLKRLRALASQKQRNVRDLEEVLYNDLRSIQNNVPRWFYALMVIHFFIVLNAWPKMPVRFTCNLICFFWLQRRFYRDIHPIAVPVSCFVLLCSFSLQ